jgi:hypothetical protein
VSWVDEVLDELGGLPGVELRPPARDEDIRRLELEWGILLPGSLADLLWRTNGVSWKDGYGRLFGVGPGATRDLVAWNLDSGWKARYPKLWSSYLLIGESADAYQWGFWLDDLREPDPDPPVWFLSPVAMAISRKPLGETFAGYVQKGLLFNARGYWDARELELKLRFPGLPCESLLLHAPPPALVDGDGDPEQYSMLPAEQVMRIHADAWDALQAWPEGAALVSFTLEPDEEGWLRLLPVWSS